MNRRGPLEPHDFWQGFADPPFPEPPFRDGFPARLPDGLVLMLPIRPLGDGETAIASLILNQAAFAVEDTLARQLTDALRAASPDVVVGLPTLGLSLARLVAGNLGHRRFVALGTSRKFWYDDGLSAPLGSITSPGAAKRLFLDPRMLPLLRNRRVALIDDVISSGQSMAAALGLLELAGVRPVAIGAAMLQTRRWVTELRAIEPSLPDLVHGAFDSPLLVRENGGWVVAEQEA